MENKELGFEEKKIEKESKNTDKNSNNSPILVNKKVKFVYYICIFIMSILINYFILDFESEYFLGDFGSIVPLLLSLFVMQTLKWCPLFCIVGIILTILDDKFKELNTAFFVITGFLIITAVILILVI